MFDLWNPPSHALIIPPERAAIIRPGAPKNSPPSTLGLTMLARTAFMRTKRAAASAPAGVTIVGAFEGQNDGNSTLTVNLSATASGDVCYAFHAGTQYTTTSAPTGYTAVAESSYYFGTYGLKVSRKVLTGADTTCVFPANGFSGSAGSVGGVLVLRGVNATPEDATTVSLSDQTSGQPDSNAITTVTSAALLISAFAAIIDVSDITYTAPSGYTKQVDYGGNAGSSAPMGLGIATLTAPSVGSNNPGAWSGVTLDSGEYGTQWAALTLAIRPA